ERTPCGFAHPRGRDIVAPLSDATFPAARREYSGPCRRAATPSRRAGWFPVVLRALRQSVVRRILRADGYREAISTAIRAFLRQSRAAHMLELRHCHAARRV